MASDDKKIKPSPARKNEIPPKDKSTPAPKNEVPPKDKSTPAPKNEVPPSDKSGSGADAEPSGYSRGEGQKPVSKAYKENWNAIFAKKKKR